MVEEVIYSTAFPLENGKDFALTTRVSEVDAPDASGPAHQFDWPVLGLFLAAKSRRDVTLMYYTQDYECTSFQPSSSSVDGGGLCRSSRPPGAEFIA